jgi:alpha-galactosidase
MGACIDLNPLDAQSRAPNSALQLHQGAAVALDGTPVSETTVRMQLNWNGPECHPEITNVIQHPIRLKEVVLLKYSHSLPPDTWIYGEGFQMLTQTDSSLGSIHELGYREQQHYRIPGPRDAAVVTSLLTLAPPGGGHELLAYTSSRRWVGRFYLRSGEIAVVVDTEGLELAPGETWHLEGFTRLSGNDRAQLLDHLAARLNANHPHRPLPSIPMGWCSWYSFAQDTTTQEVVDNLQVITTRLKGLKYVQIDDGYQPAMGDWLEQGKSFGGNVQGVLKSIRERGLEPAIWVAPFIASTNSIVLREHPEWFVKNATGQPLRAADVTFGGWGAGGWYCLDGTHPEVQQHLECVFRVMREQWGCSYFKLDANFWGAVHGGHFHDPKATRVAAYRRGMEAIRRATGDAFILGCNHPIWPSLGLIDGSRSSGDIARNWKTVSTCMQQSMDRNWQNGRLWWNDPDAVLLANRDSGPMAGTLTEEEFRFHATSAYACGGLILSGDDLTTLTAARMEMLRKLMPPTGIAAVFDNPATLEIGRIHTSKSLHIAVFNRGAEDSTIAVPLRGKYRVAEIWTGMDLGVQQDGFSLRIPAHGARLLELITAR